MNFQFTNPEFLWLLLPAVAWVLWWALRSDVQVSAWRRWTSLVIRLVVIFFLVFAMAGVQWMKPREGVNVLYLLDRSDSIPSQQQDAARKYVNETAKDKKEVDNAGLVVFGSEAAIEFSPAATIDPNNNKVLAVVGAQRTDIAAAIRLGTAAFPEHGQKRIVLVSDGNENAGDALASVLAARPLGVTVDVLPLGVERGNDVSLQKLTLPNRVKEDQPFEAKILVNADQAQDGTLRLYRNDEYLGEQKVKLDKGKNVFTIQDTIKQPGFYSYSAVIEAKGDMVPQNNRATSFVHVRGKARLLLVSAEPDKDQPLAEAIRSSNMDLKLVSVDKLPGTLAELQSYDAIFISNISAGDLGEERMKLLESAVRDFGVGLVCVGGDQTYAAGAYRGTPLENTLPVNMELDSRKVLPKGAMVMVMHGMEFPGANEAARETALAALTALGPQDEMGVVLWDGNERWLFPLKPVGDKQEMGRAIAGMNQGDLPSFQGVMTKAYQALKNSTANLKHIIVFSDGDPGPPSQALMDSLVASRITVSTVMIGGHVQPDTMMWMADKGKGRFYDVALGNADKLPEIFIKESAVILKSAIYEEPFTPKQVSHSEALSGIAASAYPRLLGYVCTTPKPRAEIPLVSDKGDPILAHWQYGLGRAVAFTSDAKARWAKDWLGWNQYRQFWSQIAQWSLRLVENADFNSEISVERGDGELNVEALDAQGNYRNFLNLQAVVVSPKGERQLVRLEQTGPGHYEAKFPTKEVGAYVLNLLDVRNGQPRGSQVLGASLNYSPEFAATEPNFALLKQLAEMGGGRVLKPQLPSDNPFLHDRKKTFQPVDWWEWLLKSAIILFVLDVGVRRIMIDRDEWLKATQTLRRWLFFWEGKPRTAAAEESLSALLARRESVRARQTAPAAEPNPDLFRPVQTDSSALPEIKPATASDAGKPVEPAPPGTSKKDGPPVTTTSRLLDAKRRAQKKTKAD
ncbi:MAG: glutamine amidotransferase [Verrucomicrobiota bacterium]